MPPAGKLLPCHPPIARLNLIVGITGHRPPALDVDQAFAEREQVRIVLAQLATAAVALGAREPALLDGSAFKPRLITSLAEGADQIVADVALDLDFGMDVVLPLPRADYLRDFAPAGARRFDELIARAARVLELPQQDADRDEGYVLAGRAIVAHCDILIALWDGAPARGPGGTADNVALALRRGTPVIHLPVGQPEPGRILWSGYGDFVDPDDLDALPMREVSDASLAEIVSATLGPPTTGDIRADLETYLVEPERRNRPRVEYPLMLAALLIKPLRRSSFRTLAYEAAIRSEWETFHDRCGRGRHGFTLDMDGIERSFAWADQLAQLYAQTYRSGHILNFALAALAVLIALAGLLLPGIHFMLALAEPAAIIAFVVNTVIGTRRQWHRRWLEYRQLAERIRPMRSLKLLGVTAPPIVRHDDPAAGGWVEWYSRAQWRAAGCPSGCTQDMAALLDAIVAEEIAPQIAYHRASAHQMHLLDHRLHILGMILFTVSILSCVGSAFATLFAPQFAHGHMLTFVAVSAGLPAIGSAIFGIRTQGDFCGTAHRSFATAHELDRIVATLRTPGLNLSRRFDLIEAAAATMLSELGQWRSIYERRKLELPG